MLLDAISRLALSPIDFAELDGNPIILCKYTYDWEESANKNILLVHVNQLGLPASDFAYNVGQCKILPIWSYDLSGLKEVIKVFQNAENLLSQKEQKKYFDMSLKYGLKLMDLWKENVRILK